MGRSVDPRQRAVGAWLLAGCLSVWPIPAPGVVAATPSGGVPSPVPLASPLPGDPPAATGGWPAFRSHLAAYLAIADPAIAAIRDALFSGNDGGAGSAAASAGMATVELQAWLGANPPEDCFADAWSAIANAAELLAPVFASVADRGAGAASDSLIESAEALGDAAAVAARLAPACEPAPGSPTPSARWATAGRRASPP